VYAYTVTVHDREQVQR